jgi:hypothetical protein
MIGCSSGAICTHEATRVLGWRDRNGFASVRKLCDYCSDRLAFELLWLLDCQPVISVPIGMLDV